MKLVSGAAGCRLRAGFCVTGSALQELKVSYDNVVPHCAQVFSLTTDPPLRWTNEAHDLLNSVHFPIILQSSVPSSRLSTEKKDRPNVSATGTNGTRAMAGSSQSPPDGGGPRQAVFSPPRMEREEMNCSCSNGIGGK